MKGPLLWIILIDYIVTTLTIVAAGLMVWMFRTTGAKLAMAAVMIECVMALSSMVFISPFDGATAWAIVRVSGRVFEATILWWVTLERIAPAVRDIQSTLSDHNDGNGKGEDT